MNLFERIDKLERKVLNVETGLTTLPAYTAGSVLFAKSTGIITQNNNNFFWDNTNIRLGIATNTPGVRLELKGTDSSVPAGPHIQTIGSADAHPLLQVLSYLHDNIQIGFDAYWDGSNYKSADAGSNFVLSKVSDTLRVRWAAGVTAGNNLTLADAFGIDNAGNVGVGTVAPLGIFDVLVTDAGTTNAPQITTFRHNSSGTPAANFGTANVWNLKSSTTNDQNAFQLNVQWVVATHASRTARARFFAYDTAAREVFRMEASGTAAMMGFLGGNAAAKQTVTGVRTGTLAQLQTVVANMLTAAANYGFWTDSTT